MAQAHRRRRSAAVTKTQKRLSATVDERTARKAATYAKACGVTLGAVVQDALEAHLRGFYWCDGRAGRADVQDARDAPDVHTAEAG